MKKPHQNTPDGPAAFRLSPKVIFTWAAGLIIVFALIIVLLAFVSLSIFRHLYQKAPDPIASYQVNKTVRAGVPSWSSVEVSAERTIPVRLSKILEADIPFNQNVDVPVDNDFTIPLDVTLSIPIDQEIFVETEVPLKTEIPLDGVRVQTRLWGLKNISLPLNGTFPVNLTIPFKRPVHIKTRADVRIQQDVTVHVNKVFSFPLDLKAHVRLPVDDVFQVSLPDIVTVNARVPEKIPVDVQVNLDLPKQRVLELVE